MIPRSLTIFVGIWHLRSRCPWCMPLLDQGGVAVTVIAASISCASVSALAIVLTISAAASAAAILN